MLPIVGLLLKNKGLKRTERLLARRIPGGARQANDSRDESVWLEHQKTLISTTALAVGRAANHGFYRGKCLEQAFTLWWMLAMMGVDSQIRLGIYQSVSAGFEAHAWVEYCGQVVFGGETSPDRFKPLLDIKVSRTKD